MIVLLIVLVGMTMAMPQGQLPGLDAVKTDQIGENKPKNVENVEGGRLENHEEFSSPDAVPNEHQGIKFD